MNILVPDSWLRDFLQTRATPKQIKEDLSLCGPSIERLQQVGTEQVFDVEVTTNRPDAMSIFGIAREALAILPRFNLSTKLINDPYALDTKSFAKKYAKEKSKKLHISTDSKLNPRWTSIVIDKIKVGPSPDWLAKKLELTGFRPVNNVVDITNYLMRAFGQPAHAFDYDLIKPKNGITTMALRGSKKGEKITTLDGKTHTLLGGDIVIEDGAGRLIDLCGIMGGLNSSIKESTQTVVLFMQTYDSVQIRKTSMSLAHHTEAAALFEKGLDPELVLPAIIKGVELVTKLTGGKVASRLYDLYPKPFKATTVSVTRSKVDSYLGTVLKDSEIITILSSLGFGVAIHKDLITVTVPSFRQDIEIDVDVIEEIARIYGYHNIKTTLPESAPPVVFQDPLLIWEEEIKIRLRDWGYTETYTYSMISEAMMDEFHLDKTSAYKITNPLSKEWVYMRPRLLPSLLTTLRENINRRENLSLFELSMVYEYKPNNLPHELPTLGIISTGEQFLKLKGIAEALFELTGIPFPGYVANENPHGFWDTQVSYVLGGFGAVGQIDPAIVAKIGIKKPVTALVLNFEKLVRNIKKEKQYQPIPKYSPLIEDITFVFPKQTAIGEVLSFTKRLDVLIYNVELIDQFENAFTFKIHFLDSNRQLSSVNIDQLRSFIISQVTKMFSANVKD